MCNGNYIWFHITVIKSSSLNFHVSFHCYSKFIDKYLFYMRRKTKKKISESDLCYSLHRCFDSDYEEWNRTSKCIQKSKFGSVGPAYCIIFLLNRFLNFYFLFFTSGQKSAFSIENLIQKID